MELLRGNMDRYGGRNGRAVPSPFPSSEEVDDAGPRDPVAQHPGAGRFRSRIVLHVGERKASARSIMAVLMLAAAMGTTVRVEIEGPDEVAALEAVASVLGAASDRA